MESELLKNDQPNTLEYILARHACGTVEFVIRLSSYVRKFSDVQLKKKHRKYALQSKKRCWYCGDVLTRRSASIDHQVPLSRNGSNQKENKVLACKPCNHLKDSMDVETYRSFLLDRLPRGERIIFFGERV